MKQEGKVQKKVYRER